MHEISHVLCGHSPARVDVTEDGLLVLNTYDKKQEEEADWLAATLLLPRTALLNITRQGLNVSEDAVAFGVSRQLMEMRINQSGIRVQLRRSAARRSLT